MEHIDCILSTYSDGVTEKISVTWDLASFTAIRGFRAFVV
jgi:hypothetical protein